MPKRAEPAAPVADDATERVASRLIALVQALVAKGRTRAESRRFVLRCAGALFVENGRRIPTGAFDPNALTSNCLFPQTFAAMGLASVQLDGVARDLLEALALEDWSRVHPGVLGDLFQSTQHAKDRRRSGAHYTPDHAIVEYVLKPAFLEAWRERIDRASTLSELTAVYEALAALRILDPACGGGNFLYASLVALHRLRDDIDDHAKKRFFVENRITAPSSAHFGIAQLFGLDIDPEAVDMTKITLWLGHRRLCSEGTNIETPPAMLDANIQCADALFCEWPKADLILGNPPFQSKNRMQQEFGPDYVRRLRNKYPDVPGRADYCVYWFRRAHDELAPGARAGLVGTNTIRENDSRKGGLDYIVKNGGTITDAVSSMVWPGEAIVHVSVVNWIKGPLDGQKRLSWQEGDSLDSPWHETRLPVIPASLSRDADVTGAETLQINADSGSCFQGQTHGHEGFLLSHDEASTMLRTSMKNEDVIHPYLIGDDLLSNVDGAPSRWVIDFHPRELLVARTYALPFQRVKAMVLPDRESAARDEKERNEQLGGSGNNHHANFLKRWWHLSYPRGELMTKLSTLSRYIVCSRVTKRPVFAFVHAKIHPSDALSVFPLEDDYSFGILQSAMHWAWFTARCSTLTARFRYTSDTVFDSFPWPQAPTKKQCQAVAKAAVALRGLRHSLGTEHHLTLRAMYTSVEEPGEHPLKEAHASLDKAVRAAYGLPARKDALTFLLELNHECARKEALGDTMTGPGLPKEWAGSDFVTKDCIEPTPLSV
jgi:SAM-dependent methyltransferase